MPELEVTEMRQKHLRSVLLACRYSAISVLSSALLFAFAGAALVLVQHPEQFIQVPGEKHVKNAETHVPRTDPNWDGTMAGVGVGYIIGSFDPIVAAPIGALLGGIVGHELDKQH